MNIVHAPREHSSDLQPVPSVPFGSGLNTLSNYNWSEFKRITWDDCSNNSKEDCLTPKGFTFMRWNPAPGLYIDVYNVHADAGTTDGDYKSRASNINQVHPFASSFLSFII
jgi:hypothetical protein